VIGESGLHPTPNSAAPLPSRSHPPLKEELSTLLRRGIFYFALTRESAGKNTSLSKK